MDIIKFILGLLVDKTRKLAANGLKEGDVTDETFRRLVERETDEIKWKLDGLARANLLASITFFEEGLIYLYKVLDIRKGETTQGADEIKEVNLKATLRSSTANTKTVSIANEMGSLLRIHVDQDEVAARALSDAKDRFKDARRKATEAFCNGALSTPDRVLAMQFRLWATLLEKVDNLTDALAACKLCLVQLHSMPAVQKCFKAQLQQGLWTRLFWFNRTERQQIVRSVCRLNRAVYDVTEKVSRRSLLLWPCIHVDTGKERVDPLRDPRLAEFCKLDVEPFTVSSVPWSLGEDGEEEYKLIFPCAVASNTQGQIIAVDAIARDFKVFQSSGKYLYSSPLLVDVIVMDLNAGKTILQGMATDQEDSVYLLVSWKKSEKSNKSVVVMLDKHLKLQHDFLLKKGSYGHYITVNDNSKIYVGLLGSDVQIYDKRGQFVDSFGNGILKRMRDMTAANDGRIMVLDAHTDFNSNGNYFLHLFSEQGDHLSKIKLEESEPYCPYSIAFHRPSESVVVLSADYPRTGGFDRKTTQREGNQPRAFDIYTKDGDYTGRIVADLDTECTLLFGLVFEARITVTKDGQLAMCVFDFPARTASVLVF